MLVAAIHSDQKYGKETAMKDFAGKTAVITGGGTGMGRELALQLVAEGCNVAMCDVSAPNMAETKRRCDEQAPQGTRVCTYVADVSIEKEISDLAAAVRGVRARSRRGARRACGSSSALGSVQATMVIPAWRGRCAVRVQSCYVMGQVAGRKGRTTSRA